MEFNEKTSILPASHYLFVYQRRMQGWEEGLLKYPEPLYLETKKLVESLKNIPEDSPCYCIQTKENEKVYATWYADEKEICRWEMSADLFKK